MLKLATPLQSSNQPRLFFYGRFSSARQEQGDSFRRQMDDARRWADANGYILDDTLTMFDHALSAYHGDHVRKGALGVFLVAIREKGLVSPGDVLFVESLDRLSRAEPLEAVDQFRAIIDTGVMIVTADGDRYSRELLKRDPSPLFLALAKMIRAHDESATKSRRVADAIRNKCKEWEKGTWRGQIGSGHDPSWVRYNKDRRAFELIPEQAESMRALLALYREGYAPQRAFDEMRARDIPMPNGVSCKVRLHAVMANRNLVGEKVVKVRANEKENIPEQTFTLTGYYPPLLTEAEFASLQYVRAQKGRRAGKTNVVGVVTGLGITVCAKCGFSMGGQNIMCRPKQANGLPLDSHRRLLCIGGNQAKDRCDAGSCSVVPIEYAVMKHCSNELNLAALFADSNERSRALREALALARQAVADTKKQVRKFLLASASDNNVTPDAMKEYTRELEGRQKAEERKVTHYEHELESLQRHSQPAAAQVWAELREGVLNLDNAARTKARQLVMDSFRKIEISLVDRDMIGIQLVSKRDVIHILWVDRVSGELRDDFTVLDATPYGLADTMRGLERAA